MMPRGWKPDRRRFLEACAGALALHAGAAPSGKPLRGIFPIAQTPFRVDGGLDVETLVAELEFVHRGGVHGFVWPQLASEWGALSEAERRAGAEALVAAGRKWKPAIVIGVQGTDAASAVRYAKHAHEIGADAVIALPPPGQPSEEEILSYYRQVGGATPLPVFVQAVGKISVDLVVRLWKSTPTISWIKDEAGEPLMRVGPLRQASADRIQVFTGNHGKTMIDEMMRGTAGTMPAASFADLYAAAWDEWHSGNQNKAIQTFSQALLFITEVQTYGVGAMKYILELRGVFRNHVVRQPDKVPLDDAAKELFARLLQSTKPYLRI